MIAYLKTNKQTIKLAGELKVLDPGFIVAEGDTLIHLSSDLTINRKWNFYISTYGECCVLVILNTDLHYKREIDIKCVETIYHL